MFSFLLKNNAARAVQNAQETRTVPASFNLPVSAAPGAHGIGADWITRTNPLAGLSIREAQNVFQAARGGNFSRLQWLYSEIERADPILLVCVERRLAAVAGMGWRIVADATEGEENAALAERQKAVLNNAFRGIPNLTAAVEHLALAFFRGYSAVFPRWDGANPSRLDLVNPWNLTRDPATGAWFWNPTANWDLPGSKGQVPLNSSAFAWIWRDRPIDYPGMAIYVRKALGERDWGRFVERYGLPPAIFTMPPLASAEQQTAYRDAAAAIADGKSGAIPNGSAVNFADGARGVNPFAEFVEHQQKLIVLLATGGTLTSLAEAGSGTLAGNAQMDVWREIVARDAVAISDALNACISARVLDAYFPGAPHLARFEIGGDRDLTAAEIFDIGAKARAAGYRISKEDLEKATGYRLEEENAGGMAGGFGFNAAPAAPAVVENAEPETTATGEAAAANPTPAGDRAMLEALAADFPELASEVEKALAADDWQTALADLGKRLPEFLPEDSALAALMESEIAKAFAGGLEQEAEKEKEIENGN